MPNDKDNPASGRSRTAENANLGGMQRQCSTTNTAIAPANVLLARLEHVKNYGEGWRAKCPAHDGKTTTSLAVNISDRGAILLHCFGACTALAVMQALGLELSDLYPQKLTRDMSPNERKNRSLGAKQAQWEAARSMLQLEARIVWEAGRQIKGGEPLNDDDSIRLDTALERITEAGVALHAP